MKSYKFIQQFSHGYLKDMPREIIVNAENAEEANKLAEEQGVYFDGVIEGSDCPCCGDRWWRAFDE